MFQPVIVVNSQLYSNPYQRLLYSALEGRYHPIKGNPSHATDLIERGIPALFHIHWEEGIFRAADSKQDGRNIVRRFVKHLRTFKDAGGKIVWTIHNAHPHERGHGNAFYYLRKELASLVDIVLVHNLTSADLIKQQCDLLESQVLHLPHPSYAGVYEEALSHSNDAPMEQHLDHTRSDLLVFGKIRGYKRTHELFAALPSTFMQSHELAISIYGEASQHNLYAARLKKMAEGRPDIKLDFEFVDDSAVAPLFKNALAALVPYENALTSGVAILGLTLGTPLIAPRVAQVLELVPAAGQSLLFEPGSPTDLQRAITERIEWSHDQLQDYQKACGKWAASHRPAVISKRLGQIYDQLLDVN